jgi:hypothetical protein
MQSLSRLQTLLFMHNAGIAPAISTLNAMPKIVGQVIGVIWTFLGGVVIGKWILGYKESYEEYQKS